MRRTSVWAVRAIATPGTDGEGELADCSGWSQVVQQNVGIDQGTDRRAAKLRTPEDQFG
ncbi:MAG TPA: hypothetical protein VKB88_00880 [Bryobacteraceae bacterium]|nr:hypothetical protein [Bryobacteraceae bacterium]